MAALAAHRLPQVRHVGGNVHHLVHGLVGQAEFVQVVFRRDQALATPPCSWLVPQCPARAPPQPLPQALRSRSALPPLRWGVRAAEE